MSPCPFRDGTSRIIFFPFFCCCCCCCCWVGYNCAPRLAVDDWPLVYGVCVCVSLFLPSLLPHSLDRLPIWCPSRFRSDFFYWTTKKKGTGNAPPPQVGASGPFPWKKTKLKKNFFFWGGGVEMDKESNQQIPVRDFFVFFLCSSVQFRPRVMNHRPTGRRRRATGLRRLMSADDVVMSVTQRCTPSTSIKNEKKNKTRSRPPSSVSAHVPILSYSLLHGWFSLLVFCLFFWRSGLPILAGHPIRSKWDDSRSKSVSMRSR